MSAIETGAFIEVLPPPEDEGVLRTWQHFAAISAIPRPSGSEQLVVEYLKNIAQSNKYELEVDGVGNVHIQIPATVGYEDKPGLLFQGHSDMVDVMTKDAPRNPTTEGVLPIVQANGEWLTAEKTSLGADNGIGLAAGLAILEEDIPHGPLGILVTVDEERGLLGAQEVAFDLSRYKYMVNLDSEDVAEMTIGCAGGEDTVINLPIATRPISSNESLMALNISGLRGGHSGIDIGLVGKERANAIKTVTQLITLLSQDIECSVVSINGGTKRNLIPSEAGVVLAVASDKLENAERLVRENFEAAISSYTSEDAVQVEIERVEMDSAEGFTSESKDKVLETLTNLPDGVQVWSSDIPGMPETSTNLAVVNTLADSVNIRLMTRSAVVDGLKVTQADIASAVELVPGAGIAHEGGYPGWEPNPQSSLVNLVQTVNNKLNGEELEITATHGGLECGLLIDKYSHLEMVSIGPDIEGAHSVNERVNISSVERFYSLVKGIVASVARS